MKENPVGSTRLLAICRKLPATTVGNIVYSFFLSFSLHSFFNKNKCQGCLTDKTRKHCLPLGLAHRKPQAHQTENTADMFKCSKCDYMEYKLNIRRSRVLFCENCIQLLIIKPGEMCGDELQNKKKSLIIIIPLEDHCPACFSCYY